MREYVWFEPVIEPLENVKTQMIFLPVQDEKCKWYLKVIEAEYSTDILVCLCMCDGSICTADCFTEMYLQLLTSDDIIITDGAMQYVRNQSHSYEYRVQRRMVLPLIRNVKTFKIRILLAGELSQTLPKFGTTGIQKKQKSSKMLSQFENMFKNRVLSDFVIKTNDDSEIPVHRCILAARSKVFSAMFAHDTAETNVGYVKIQDIEEHIMLCLLNFLYSGRVETSSEDEAKKLLMAAEKYEITDLKDCCAEMLMLHIDNGNVIEILILAYLHNVPELKRAAINYYSKNARKFSSMDKFKEIKKFPDLLAELLMEISKLAV